MADPQAIDAGERGDGLGVLDALGGLDLTEQRAAAVCGGEFVHDGARPIAIMRDLQGDAAAAFWRVFHRVEDVAGFIALPTIGSIRPSAPMSMARAM